MGVISKGCIRGGKKRPGRACQHCDTCYVTWMVVSTWLTWCIPLL